MMKIIKSEFVSSIGCYGVGRSSRFCPRSIKLEVGMMLPYSGNFCGTGNAIDNGFQLYVKELGGKIGGREITYIRVDDESEPSKATDKISELIKRDN
jgi:branched-chain amino acid transport system substrate-binding protein